MDDVEVDGDCGVSQGFGESRGEDKALFVAWSPDGTEQIKRNRSFVANSPSRLKWCSASACGAAIPSDLVELHRPQATLGVQVLDAVEPSDATIRSRSESLSNPAGWFHSDEIGELAPRFRAFRERQDMLLGKHVSWHSHFRARVRRQ